MAEDEEKGIVKRDKYGRTHGLSTKEWKAWLDDGKMMPILEEIKRRQPDMWPMFSVVYESLLNDPELKFSNPVDVLRVTLYVMREVRLLVYELENDVADLPETHPQLMNAIDRGVKQAEAIKAQYRVVTVKSALFQDMQDHIDSLKLEVKFKDGVRPDEDLEVIEGAFKHMDDDEEEEEDDTGDSE